MSRAVYTFFDKSSKQTADLIEFELNDTVGCRAWQYAVMLNSPSRNLFRTKAIKPVNLIPPHDIETTYSKLKQIIDRLSQTQFPYTDLLPVSFKEVDQKFMNRLHRHFTNSLATVWNHVNADTYSHDTEKLLQDLNNIIHELELSIITPRKLKYQNIKHEIWALNDGGETGYDISPFRKFHSYEHADLILDSYILGKTLLESYACDDDPTSWDTAGHMRTNGGAVIQLFPVRQEIYNSKEFENWLQSHGVKKSQKLADFPLGYFVSGHRSKLESLMPDLKKYSVELHIKL